MARTPAFVASVSPAAAGDSWLCQVTANMVPSEDAIRDATARLAAVATTLGGEFDGWEAAVAQ